MKQSYDIVDRRNGHLAALNVYQHCIKPEVAGGGRGRLEWVSMNPTTRAGMRRLLHGFILPEFAAVTGHGVVAWKAWLTEKFCPEQFDEDGNELAKSTERMSDPEYGDFLLEVQAFGVVDLGMQFPEQPHPPASPAAPSAAQP